MRFILISISVFLSSLTFANPIALEDCPSLSLIKSEGITIAHQVTKDTFMTLHKSKYNTDRDWAFMLLPVMGNTIEEALEHANALLNNLSSPGEPNIDTATGMFYCRYDTGRVSLQAAIFHAEDIFHYKKALA